MVCVETHSKASPIAYYTTMCAHWHKHAASGLSRRSEVRGRRRLRRKNMQCDKCMHASVLARAVAALAVLALAVTRSLCRRAMPPRINSDPV